MFCKPLDDIPFISRTYGQLRNLRNLSRGLKNASDASFRKNEAFLSQEKKEKKRVSILCKAACCSNLLEIMHGFVILRAQLTVSMALSLWVSL
jgi:hypothetical protein